jgi:hypothetical protein
MCVGKPCGGLSGWVANFKSHFIAFNQTTSCPGAARALIVGSAITKEKKNKTEFAGVCVTPA